jgi:uncharacterized YccA/Bax inhibitor family protein
MPNFWWKPCITHLALYLIVLALLVIYPGLGLVLVFIGFFLNTHLPLIGVILGGLLIIVYVFCFSSSLTSSKQALYHSSFSGQFSASESVLGSDSIEVVNIKSFGWPIFSIEPI